VQQYNATTAVSNYVVSAPLSINNQVNDAPVITSTPVVSAIEDYQYNYMVTATDEEHDPLVFFLTKAPDSMRIDSVSGIITWAPRNENVGLNIITVKVKDSQGGVGQQTFNITVSNTNDAPRIVSVPVTNVAEDSLYRYDVNAVDPDTTWGDTVTYRLVTAPDSMRINGSTGVITWTPRRQDIGLTDVVVRVTDKQAVSDTQQFTITVAHVNHTPGTPALLSPTDGMQVDETAALVWQPSTDIDSGDVVTYRLEISTSSNFGTLHITQDSIGSTFAVLEELTQASKLQRYGLYYWRVRAGDNLGAVSAYSNTFYFVFIGNVAVHDFFAPAAGNTFIVSSPCRTVVLNYTLAQRTQLRVTVHDGRGRMIGVLADGLAGPGVYHATWNGTLEPGIYLVRITTPGMCRAERVLIIE
jgi:hypothetical protein